MTIYNLYLLAFIALSGLGITFLNSESILALCFFIFFALILQNSDSMSESLEQSRHAVRAELISCMIDGEKHSSASQKLQILKKHQLLTGMDHMSHMSWHESHQIK